MSYRELLEAGTTFQTRHRMFSDAFPPVDSFWWCLWCYTGNAAMRVLLCLQGLQPGIGLLDADFRRAKTINIFQIPPDFVVKSQLSDIIDIIL